jgi:predicted nucleic acid-binding protein
LIAYLDSSILAQAYLEDEPGHAEARALVEDDGIVRITGTWSLIEVSGAIVRAARAGRTNLPMTLRRLDADLADDGHVAVLDEPQARIDEIALRIVRSRGLRAMDAWHLAVASVLLPQVAEPDEEIAFATRDSEQAQAARAMGLAAV